MDNQELQQMMRNEAMRIFRAALEAVDPEEAIARHVRMHENHLLVGETRFSLEQYDRVIILGAGKANAPMALALENICVEKITQGLIVVKDGHTLPLNRIRVCEASHPVPDDRGIDGTEEILSLLQETGERDLILCLISGGGSALLVAPADGVTLQDKQEVTRQLLACGATIHEINAVRKHLSKVKGGGLARLAHPATLVSLILSDVVGDDLDVIASGPTYPDSSTFDRATSVLRRHEIWEQTPLSVRDRFEKGIAGEIPETPKPGDTAFEHCHWRLVGTNLQALQAASEESERSGYQTLVLTSGMEGEAREVAKVHVSIAEEIIRSGNPVSPPACLLSGGETTVTLKGEGLGGRNQEFVLAAALALEDIRGAVIMSGGTDGTDGPTDAAGAVADGGTINRARSMKLDAEDYLRRNDAYRFFDAIGDLVVTGPTRTNVMDVCVVLVRKP